MQRKPDALTEVLQTAALCLFIVLAMCVGAMIDTAAEADLQLRAAAVEAAAFERGRDAGRAELVDTVRDAYRAGLDEGAQREHFRRQRELQRQDDHAQLLLVHGGQP